MAWSSSPAQFLLLKIQSNTHERILSRWAFVAAVPISLPGPDKGPRHRRARHPLSRITCLGFSPRRVHSANPNDYRAMLVQRTGQRAENSGCQHTQAEREQKTRRPPILPTRTPLMSLPLRVPAVPQPMITPQAVLLRPRPGSLSMAGPEITTMARHSNPHTRTLGRSSPTEIVDHDKSIDHVNLDYVSEHAPSQSQLLEPRSMPQSS